MTPEEESIQQKMIQDLLKVSEMMEPVIESAEGFKRQLEARGWSPTAAEKVAAEMLMRLIRG